MFPLYNDSKETSKSNGTSKEATKSKNEGANVGGFPTYDNETSTVKKKDGGVESTNDTLSNEQSLNGQNTSSTTNPQETQKAQTNIDNKQATAKDVSVIQKNADDIYSGNTFLNLKNNLDRKAFAASNNKLSPTEVVNGVQNVIQKHWDNINPIDVKSYAKGEAMATQRNYIDNLTAKPNPADPNIQNEVNKNTPSVILNTSADAIVANREAKSNLLAKVQSGDIMATRDMKELTRKGIQDKIDYINNNPEGQNKTESVSGATVFTQSTSRQLSKSQQEEINQLKQEQEGIDNIFEDYAKLNIVNDARKKPGGMYMPDNVIDAGRQVRLYRNGITRFQNEEDIKDHTAITYKNYYDEQAGLSTLYDVQQSEYADAVKQHLLTDNPNLVADINMKGSLLEETRNKLQDLPNKYQPVRLNYVARIMGDEISEMHPVSNVFITDKDRQEAVNRLDKKYPGFADKYKNEIAQLNNQTLGFLETKIPHQGFYGSLTRGLATGGEELRRSALDLLGVRDRTDRAADEYTDAMNSYAAGTAQSGNAPSKIVVSDNGKTFEEKENENYGTYNFNNSINKVGAFVGGIIPFVVATEVGAAGAERIINGAAKLADVANSAAKVKRMSTLAEFGETDVLGGEAVLAANEGSQAWQLGARAKQMYGTAIGTYLMNYDANLKTADKLIDDDSGAGDSKKMLAANLLTLGQAAAFSALPPNVFARNLLMKGLEQDAVTILSKAGEEDILATGKKGIQSWLTNYVKPRVLNVAETLKNQGLDIGKVNLEMLALNHSNATISNLFDETGATRNANVWHDDIETIKDMTLGSVAMAAMGFAGRGLVKSTVGGVKEGIPDMLNNAFSMTVRDALYDVASQPDQEVSRLRGMIDNGLIDREQGNGIIKIIKTAGKHFGEIIAAKNDEGNPLTIKQKAQKLSEMVRRDILNERKGEEHVDGKISETDNAITAIDGDNRYNSIRPVTDINGKITGYERVTPENITPAEEKRITSQLEPEKLAETQGIIDRINNKESINENEINNASTHLYDLWDKADEKTKNLIEPLIEKLENYDAKTKTETSTTTEEGAVTRVGTDVASKAVEKNLSQWDGSRAVIHNADGTTTEGTIGGNNLNFHLVDKDGEVIEDLGNKVELNKNISLPDANEVPHPIQLDEDGNVKSITLQLNKVDERGDLVKDKQITVDFKDPEKALDYAIRLRAEQVGEFSEPEFEKIITEVSKEVPIESQNKTIQNEKNINEISNAEVGGEQQGQENGQEVRGGQPEGQENGQGGSEKNNEDSKQKEVTSKTENNATQESSKQQQESNQQGSIGEHTGTESKRNETAQSETDNSNSGIGSEKGQETLENKSNTTSEEPKVKEGEYPSFSQENNKKTRQAGLKRHLMESDAPQSVKDKFKDNLDYSVANSKEAQTVAQGLITAYGKDEALRLARGNDFHPSVRSAIYAEAINDAYNKQMEAKTEGEKLKAANDWADLYDEYSNLLTSAGQFSAYAYHFYKTSDIGFRISAEKKLDTRREEILKKDEKAMKAFFQDLMDIPEFKAIVEKEMGTQSEKKERREASKQKISDAFDSLKLKKGQAYALPVPPQIINAAIEVMKQAVLAGKKGVEAVQDAIDYINENHKGEWNREKFRKDFEPKANSIIRGKTAEELSKDVKDKILKRIEKRLDKLPENKRRDLLSKITDEIINNGGLEYDTFKKLYADALGVKSLTPEMQTKLKELGGKLNAVETAADAMNENPTEANVKKFVDAVSNGEKASRELNDLLGSRDITFDKLTGIMRLNTLGLLNLVMNPIFNVAYMPFRFLNNVWKTGLDYGLDWTGVSKNSSVKDNVFYKQRAYFKGLGEGAARAGRNFLHGESDLDYFRNPIRANIRPVDSLTSLVKHFKGEERLTNKEVINAAVEAFPLMGGSAAVIGRTLQIGDSPFRIGAERAEAENIARQKGLTGAAKKAFILNPDAESKERIVAAGERTVMQQDNLISKWANGLTQATMILGEKGPLGKTGEYALRLLGAATQPFLKIPVNSAIAVFELAVPEYSLLMGSIHAIRGNREAALNYFSKAITGVAVGYGMSQLAAHNIIVNSADDKNKWKNSAYIQDYTGLDKFNYTALKRLLRGENPEYQDDDVMLGLQWLGVTGALMQVYANRYKDMSPEEVDKLNEQQGKLNSYLDNIGNRFSSGFIDGLKSNALSSTSTLLAAMNGEQGAVDNWMRSTTGVVLNTFEPAWLATISKLKNPYRPDYSAMTTTEKLTATLKDRFFLNDDLPSQITPWGEKRGDVPKGVNPYWHNYFDITKSQNVDAKDFGWNVAALYMKTKDNDVIPTKPRKTLFKGEAPLPAKDYEQYQIMVGKNRKELVQALMSTDEWNDASTDKKIEMLKKQYSVGYQLGKAEFLQFNPQYDKNNKEE